MVEELVEYELTRSQQTMLLSTLSSLVRSTYALFPSLNLGPQKPGSQETR